MAKAFQYLKKKRGWGETQKDIEDVTGKKKKKQNLSREIRLILKIILKHYLYEFINLHLNGGKFKTKDLMFNTGGIILSKFSEKMYNRIINFNLIAVDSTKLTLCSLNTRPWFRIEYSILLFCYFNTTVFLMTPRTAKKHVNKKCKGDQAIWINIS